MIVPNLIPKKKIRRKAKMNTTMIITKKTPIMPLIPPKMRKFASSVIGIMKFTVGATTITIGNSATTPAIRRITMRIA